MQDFEVLYTHRFALFPRQNSLKTLQHEILTIFSASPK